MDSAEGLVIIYARIRRPDIRDELWFHIENLTGERVSPTLYELSVADWSATDWEDEIAWISDLLDGTRESVVIWKFGDGNYSRTTLGNR